MLRETKDDWIIGSAMLCLLMLLAIVTGIKVTKAILERLVTIETKMTIVQEQASFNFYSIESLHTDSSNNK